MLLFMVENATWIVIAMAIAVGTAVIVGRIGPVALSALYPEKCRDEALWGPGIQRQTCRLGAVGHLENGVLMCECRGAR